MEFVFSCAAQVTRRSALLPHSSRAAGLAQESSRAKSAAELLAACLLWLAAAAASAYRQAVFQDLLSGLAQRTRYSAASVRSCTGRIDIAEIPSDRAG
jgi:hypothetical protein